MKNNIILTDIDEIVLNWYDMFTFWIINYTSYNPTSNIRSYPSINNWLNCSENQSIKLIETFNASPYFGKLLPYDDSLEYINKLFNEGREFIGITSCGSTEHHINYRKNNINKYFPNIFKTIHFCDINEPKDKFLELYNPTIWIDDKYNNILSGNKYNHTSYMKLYEYSKNIDYKNTFFHWKELYELIKQ